MIYPDVSLKEWRKKYPELKVMKLDCDNCGKTIVANRPFLTKGYAGLDAPRCECGKNRHSCSSMVTTTKEEHQSWLDVLGGEE
jgi:hypothetical protein